MAQITLDGVTRRFDDGTEAVPEPAREVHQAEAERRDAGDTEDTEGGRMALRPVIPVYAVVKSSASRRPQEAGAAGA